MNSIHNFTNIDKAVLLHHLFVEEIPQLIEFIEKMSTSIIEHQEVHRKSWDGGLMPFSYWLSLITEVKGIIPKSKKRMVQSATAFSKLFEGMLAVYTNHCITLYVSQDLYLHPKFRLAVDLLLMPAPERKPKPLTNPDLMP